jgi:hypothetical protein
MEYCLHGESMVNQFFSGRRFSDPPRFESCALLSGLTGQRPRPPSHGALRLLRIKMPLNLSLLLMTRYAVGPRPHLRQSSRRIQLYHRNHKLDRDGIVCIFDIVESPFFQFLQFAVNRIRDAT